MIMKDLIYVKLHVIKIEVEKKWKYHKPSIDTRKVTTSLVLPGFDGFL